MNHTENTTSRSISLVEERVSLPPLREMIGDIDRLIRECAQSLSAGDLGYFGPQSVAWTVYQDASAVAGGLAGLLLQALHPVAMAAVDQHSEYRQDVWRRAMSTSHYGFTVAFGSRRVADRAAERVRRIHERVRGVDPVTGRAYSAEDPDLLLWIHCAGVDCALRAYEQLARPLGESRADRYVSEMVVAADLVGIPKDKVPSSARNLRMALEEMRPQLIATDPARQVLRTFQRARMSVVARPLWALHLLAALVLLPPYARDLYGVSRWVPSGRVTTATLRFVFRALNRLYVVLPGVRAARRRIAALTMFREKKDITAID